MRWMEAISPEQAQTSRKVGATGRGMVAGAEAFDPATDDPTDPNRFLRMMKPVGVYSGMQGLASLGEGFHNGMMLRRADAAAAEQRASQRAASEAMQSFVKGGMVAGPESLAPLMAHPATRATGMQFYLDSQREKRAEAAQAAAHQKAVELENMRFDKQRVLAGEAYDRQQQDPLRQAQIAETTAQTAERIANARKRDMEANRTPDQVIQDRMAQARAAGLMENDPGYRSFLLTGKMPREDQQPLTATDKKAILEADEQVASNEGVIRALGDALKISPNAYQGAAAGARAWIGNSLWDGMVPDAVADPKRSAATAEYENLVLGQALGQLKTTFGAAPTEGERKILIDLQASVGKPHEVRVEILKRAMAAAERRRDIAKAQAEGLRGNTYYKPGFQQPGAAPKAPTSEWKVQKGE